MLACMLACMQKSSGGAAYEGYIRQHERELDSFLQMCTEILRHDGTADEQVLSSLRKMIQVYVSQYNIEVARMVLAMILTEQVGRRRRAGRKTPTHSLTHTPTHSLIHSLAHPLTHLFTHSLFHPLTRSPTHTPQGYWDQALLVLEMKKPLPASAVAQQRASQPFTGHALAGLIKHHQL
jgi:hypothetical protein